MGGGIAGVALAAEYAVLAAGLAAAAGRPAPTVQVLEREWQLAYHTSGRSAAVFEESFGSQEARVLTRASRPILDAIAAESGTPLLRTRPVLWMATEADTGRLDDMVEANPGLRRVDLTGARAFFPALRDGPFTGAAVERTAQDIDVTAILRYYQERATGSGVKLRTAIGVESGEWTGQRWRLRTDRGELTAGRLVNAAGAWGDALAVRLGVPPLGLAAKRRTVAIVNCPQAAPTWPFVTDLGETFYFRPESGGLLVSPADESPSPPCDAKADGADVQRALDRINEVTTLDLRQVRTSWAGLRTFAPDRNPVVGFDPAAPDLFWLAGQGGYGIQAAAAMARLAAGMLAGAPAAVADDLDLERLSPARFREVTAEQS